jgi:DNA-directed RNA polymerase specialized sigma24 family protein
MKTPRPRLTLVEAPRPVASGVPERASVATALGRCSEPQRTMLALLLVERLSSIEAAATLGISVGQFERSYQALMAELRRAMDRTNRARWRSAERRAAFAIARLRKAS